MERVNVVNYELHLCKHLTCDYEFDLLAEPVDLNWKFQSCYQEALITIGKAHSAGRSHGLNGS